MRVNTEHMVARSAGLAVIQGRLNYRKMVNGAYYNNAFKERWFKLVDNFLFYFRINELGKIEDKTPVGVLLLENASIQVEAGFDCPFAFSISYVDEPDKRHLFSGRTEDVIADWVEILRKSSYEYLRTQLYALQKRLYAKTGKDPLLMFPRNSDAANVGSDHRSNLLEDSASNHIFRSKSSANILRKPKAEDLEKVFSSSCGLERSNTSASVFHKQNPFELKIFDDHFSADDRAVPSPPTRKKSSSNQLKLPMKSVNGEYQNSNSQFFVMHPSSSLSGSPVAPQRRNSPNNLEKKIDDGRGDGDSSAALAVKDLIEF